MISFSNLSYSRGSQTLVSDFSLTLFSGEKIGVVGANGCGKSTLLKVILGELNIDEGDVDIPKSLRIAQVKQDDYDLERLALDYVLDGDNELRRAQAVLAKAEKDNDGHKIANTHLQLEHLGAYDAEARASKLLFGLGFDETLMNTPVGSLSGGWRVRLNLAQALMKPSDLLLLDEPTNHLDLDAVFWLESYLKSYPGTLIVISHDRDFIDALVTRVLHFDQGQIKSYSGNYSQFIRIKAEQDLLQSKQFEKQQAKVKHLQSFIDRFKAKASKAKQAQSRVKALERMATVENVRVREQFSFDFFEPLHKPDPLIQFNHCRASYGEVAVLNDIHLSLRCDSRIGLLGRNGAGKSTLLKAIVGTEVDLSGDREVCKHLNIGYFAQHQLEQLNADESAFSQMQKLDPNLTEQQVRNYLGGFAFNGDKVFAKVQSFSGGEKARLVLALMIYNKPNLILLDEPTNHLDMEMRDALTMAIQNFSGAVVVISHDRYLLDATVDELFLIDSGQVTPFEGDTQAYYQWLRQNRWGKDVSETPKETVKAEPDRKQQKQLEAKIRQQLSPFKKAVDKFESHIQQLETRLANIEQALADVTLYEDTRKAELTDLLSEQATLRSELLQLEDKWAEAQETLEQKTTELNRELLL